MVYWENRSKATVRGLEPFVVVDDLEAFKGAPRNLTSIRRMGFFGRNTGVLLVIGCSRGYGIHRMLCIFSQFLVFLYLVIFRKPRCQASPDLSPSPLPPHLSPLLAGAARKGDEGGGGGRGRGGCEAH